MNKLNPIIIIQGPTAVGKSAIALDLALEFNLEIISADSRQIYKYMDMATAKPTKEEQAMVKHHLIDIITPDQKYNAGKFSNDAINIVDKSDTSFPIMCGGTGFYIDSFLNGLCNTPKIDTNVKLELENDLHTKGVEYLYSQLCKIDPVIAKKTYSNDAQRIMRALEVFLSTGKKLSDFWLEQKNMPSRKVLNILIMDERESIYKRINSRYEQMVKNGLIEEIENLLKMGYNDNCYGLTAVGYQEILPFILYKKNLNECIELAKQHSRNYAKRQISWYRRINFDYIIFQKSNQKKNLKFFLKDFILKNSVDR